MKFDPKRRLYLDDRNRVIPPRQVRKYIDEFITHEQQLVVKAAQKLITGSFLPAEFFKFMESKITGWHSIAGTIAYGGEEQMNAVRWGRINERIFSELGYLAEFESEVEASFKAVDMIANKVAIAVAKEFPDAQAEIRERVARALFTAPPSEAATIAKQSVIEVVGSELPINVGPEAGFLIGGTIEPRAEMYPNAIWTTHEMEMLERERDNGVTLGRRICEQDGASCEECVDAATEEFVPLDDLAEIGSLQCLNNCRCEFEFSVDGTEFATSELFRGVVGGQEAYGGSVELE
jgi:hypothetical protein